MDLPKGRVSFDPYVAKKYLNLGVHVFSSMQIKFRSEIRFDHL